MHYFCRGSLSDPRYSARYAVATVALPQPGDGAPLVLRGAPIVFVLTIPRAAPQSAIALEFVQFLLSAAGHVALRRSGFTPLPVPSFVGSVPRALQTFPCPPSPPTVDHSTGFTPAMRQLP